MGAQLPDVDTQAIAVGAQTFGGQWRRELTREVTHLIAVATSGVSLLLSDAFMSPLLGASSTSLMFM